MQTEAKIIITVISLITYLTCGILLWRKRKEVPDNSRLALALFCFLSMTNAALTIYHRILGTYLITPGTLLPPQLSLGGLCSFTLFLCYPLELIWPNCLRGKRLLVLLLPFTVSILPYLLGIPFLEIHSWAQLAQHVGDFNVLWRIFSVLLLLAISFTVLTIPFSWQQSSASRSWIWTVLLFMQITTLLYLAHVVRLHPAFYYIHLGWFVFMVIYYTHYELTVRVYSPAKSMDISENDEEITPEQQAECDKLWQRITQVMEEWEAWRNPETSAETVGASIGTNRNYVTRCIRKHTGSSFTDYVNRRRVKYMAHQLRLDPTQDHKSLYFEAGFRSRQSAFRNFVKLMGCSPTDYVSSIHRPK